MNPPPAAPSDECLPDSISEDAEDESVVLEPSGSRELCTDVEGSCGRLLFGESLAGSTLLGSACGRSRQQGSEGPCLQTGLGVAGRVWWIRSLLSKVIESKNIQDSNGSSSYIQCINNEFIGNLSQERKKKKKNSRVSWPASSNILYINILIMRSK